VVLARVSRGRTLWQHGDAESSIYILLSMVSGCKSVGLRMVQY